MFSDLKSMHNSINSHDYLHQDDFFLKFEKKHLFNN